MLNEDFVLEKRAYLKWFKWCYLQTQEETQLSALLKCNMITKQFKN